MIRPVRIAAAGEELALPGLAAPLDLDALTPGANGPWEVELGFGRGTYLVTRAEAGPGRFLGVELAGLYYKIVRRKAFGRALDNLVVIRGEAQYVLSALLPRAFARAVHVYFPDPWPKSRHHKRRFLDTESVDLVLALLEPGGRLLFATDFLAFGEEIHAVLAGHPALDLRRLDEPWPEGPRTNYERKYVAEGRPILRLEAVRAREEPLFHPAGERGVVGGWS